MPETSGLTTRQIVRLENAGIVFRFVMVMWLVVAAMVALVAANAAHFSPWEFIIPGPDLWTWLAPLALFGTPLLLLLSLVASKPRARGLAWAALALLTLPFLGALTIITFPKQTGYYDPHNPDRQPGGSPGENRSN